MKHNQTRRLKHFLCKAVSLVAALAISIVSLPEETTAEPFWPEGPSVSSPNAIVMEVNTGTILYQKASHEQHYPASITKIMTTLLAVENCQMDEIVTFSADAVYKNEGDTSHIWRDVGEEMTMEQCLYAVMLFSANECAYAVAEHVGQKLGGDYQTFIDLMNTRAQEIGCTDTQFHNCNGLPDSEHWTSAYDMALISAEAYKNESFRKICGTKKYTIPPTNKHDESTPMVNHHKMLYPFRSQEYVYEYCTGGKTGYTVAANSTLVTYAEKDGLTLVCVIMNADSPDHFTDTRTLFDYDFANFQAVKVADGFETIKEEDRISFGLLNENGPFADMQEDAYIVIPKTADLSDVTFEKYENQEKDHIAKLVATYGKRQVGNIPIQKTAVTLPENAFANVQDAVPQNSQDRYVIQPVYFLYGLGALAVLVILIFLIKLLWDRIYLHKRLKNSRRYGKERYDRPRGSRRRNRRDDIFW